MQERRTLVTDTGNPKETNEKTLDATQHDEHDFSLVVGGPLYRMFLRAHLSGTALERPWRRVFLTIAITWLPLLFLAALAGVLLGGQGMPFLHDVDTHVRFLIYLPVLIFAELIIHRRLQPAVRTFLERGIVRTEDLPKYHAAIDASMKFRNSITVELALVIFCWTAGHYIWRHAIALDAASWYAVPRETSLNLTLPGYWYVFVSLPIAQFVLLRWYLRIINWFVFLWRMSRLNLRLQPMHPDGAGGIGFLGKSTYAFGPILFAQAVLLSGVIADRVLFDRESLMSFRPTILATVGFYLLAIFGPLTVFTPALIRTKRVGLNRFGTLAMSYVEDFDEKWLEEKGHGEALLGTADIQSLADLANSYSVVRGMRAVPFGLDDVKMLLAATVIPLLPLLLLILPFEELLNRLVKVVF
jgi:hypothetical protein